MKLSHLIKIAHRGASGRGLAPENTLAAFKKALQIGVDAVELDVHLSQDDNVVVVHDSTIDRTTNIQGAVAQMSLEEIKSADAGSWFGDEYKNESIPTLYEALKLITKKSISVIEIKPLGIAKEVVQVLENADVIDKCVVISFHPAALKEVRELNPQIPTGLLIGAISPKSRKVQAADLAHKVAEIGSSSALLYHRSITARLVKELHKRGINVWAWTVDHRYRMRRLAHMGVNGIISNYPNLLKEI